MLTNTDFLVFAPNPWHDLWRNRQQIFSRLAGPNRVLYVEPDRASLADWRRRRVDASQLREPTVVEEQPNLWLYRIPPWLPERDTGGLFDRSSDHLLAIHLRRTLRHLGFSTRIAHSAIPHSRTPHSALRTPHPPHPLALPPHPLALGCVQLSAQPAGVSHHRRLHRLWPSERSRTPDHGRSRARAAGRCRPDDCDCASPA